MRLRTLAAGLTLAVAGLVTSSVQADLSVGASTETRADTGLLGLDTGTKAGVEVGVGGSAQAGAQAGAEGETYQRSELESDGRADAGVRIEQESQTGLDTARDSVSRAGNEAATKARGQAQSALDGATGTLDSAQETGEAWIEEGAAVEAEGSAEAH
ncbi:hypothetical protein [Halomonas sp. H5]|uniref:hypothetical protein n=1 Tax=Halomonas sp. H5 TaxID=3423910 RepID=UPI003D3643F0